MPVLDRVVSPADELRRHCKVAVFFGLMRLGHET
jgi:hypothetical protein